jgi:glutamine amidotransferase
MIAIIDYGVGNLFSLGCSLAEIGAEAAVTGDPELIRRADKIILPGVGAFGDAANKLHAAGLDAVIKDEAEGGKPLLGICLGMQLLFERSFEFGEHAGLALIPGEIRPISQVVPRELKIPHIGWNALKIKRNGRLLRDVKDGDCVYFVHSYAAFGCEKDLTASAEYGAELTAVVERGNVMGCQFHPEKSGPVGLSILRAFCFGGEVPAC